MPRRRRQSKRGGSRGGLTPSKRPSGRTPPRSAALRLQSARIGGTWRPLQQGCWTPGRASMPPTTAPQRWLQQPRLQRPRLRQPKQGPDRPSARRPGRTGALPPDAAAAVEWTKPQRLPPLVLSGPHEAVPPPFHEDWTIVPGSKNDAEKWETKVRLREVRNKLLRGALEEGRRVWYKSSGDSM